MSSTLCYVTQQIMHVQTTLYALILILMETKFGLVNQVHTFVKS